MDKSNNVNARLFQNIKSFFAMKQQWHKTTDTYFKCFRSNLQTLNMCDVNISDHKILQQYEEKLNISSSKGKTSQIVWDKFLDMDFF